MHRTTNPSPSRRPTTLDEVRTKLRTQLLADRRTCLLSASEIEQLVESLLIPSLTTATE